MSWLFGQTWLSYLAAFAVGVGLAWVVLVRPRQRRLVVAESDAADRARRERECAARSAARPPEEPPVDDAVAAPATNPALSTLDTFATGPLRTAANPGPGGAAAAGLGAAGLPAPDDARGSGDGTTPPGPDGGQKAGPPA